MSSDPFSIFQPLPECTQESFVVDFSTPKTTQFAVEIIDKASEPKPPNRKQRRKMSRKN